MYDFIICANVVDMGSDVKIFVERIFDTIYNKKNFHIVLLAEYDSFFSKNKLTNHIQWEINQIDWKKYNGLEAFDAKNLYEIWTTPKLDGKHIILFENLEKIYNCPIIIGTINHPFDFEWYKKYEL